MYLIFFLKFIDEKNGISLKNHKNDSGLERGLGGLIFFFVVGGWMCMWL